jgi:hypothetical protein
MIESRKDVREKNKTAGRDGRDGGGFCEGEEKQ